MLKEIMKSWSLLKFLSLFGHITGFFYSPPPSSFLSFFFFLFLTVGSVPESLQVRETVDICLLKFRIICFSWSNMSGQRYNTSDHSLLREFTSFQEQIRQITGFVKSQSTEKENYILFSNMSCSLLSKWEKNLEGPWYS